MGVENLLSEARTKVQFCDDKRPPECAKTKAKGRGSVEGRFYERQYETVREHSGRVSRFSALWNRLLLHREDAVFALLRRGGRFLDLGCGDGNLVRRARARFRLVCGIDIVGARLKRAAGERASKNNAVFYVQANLNNPLPFGDRTFDAVTCVSVLEHVFDPLMLLHEISRLLIVRGILVIQVPNIAYLPRRLGLLLGRLPRTSSADGWDGGHLHYFTARSLRRAMAKEGLQVVKVWGSGRLARLRNWWSSLLCGDIIIFAVKAAWRQAGGVPQKTDPPRPLT